jgi:hypothetical protein
VADQAAGPEAKVEKEAQVVGRVVRGAPAETAAAVAAWVAVWEEMRV